MDYTPFEVAPTRSLYHQNKRIMTIRIINTLLILFVVFMGLKQGWGMLTGKSEMLAMFGKWHFNKQNLMAFGAITILSASLILFPRTFIFGNVLMASTILFIIGLQLSVKDIKGAAIELPFLLMNLLIIYLQYPIPEQSK
jgi:hypothetical protein